MDKKKCNTKRIIEILNKEKSGKYLYDNKEELFSIIPELKVCDGFNQNNKWHQFDVLTHILVALDNIKSKNNFSHNDFLILKMAVLLHDCAKPYCYTEDNEGFGHFYGHPEVCANLSLEIMKNNFCFNEDFCNSVFNLIKHHGDSFDASYKSVKKLKRNLKTDNLFLFFEMRKADILAHGNSVNSYDSKKLYEKTLNAEKIYIEILTSEEEDKKYKPVISGFDIINIGITDGKEIGFILKTLKQKIKHGDVDNSKNSLLKLSIYIHKNIWRKIK